MGQSSSEVCGVILAAGSGERIKPLSFSQPKPLLPICNKPIVQYQIEDMKRVGVKEIFIIVGHLKEKIVDYLGDGSSLGVKITYIEQENPLGIAHAVSILEDYIDKPFFVFLGDIFIVPKNFSHMLNMLKQKKASAVLAIKKEKDPEFIKRNFSVIFTKDRMVKKVIEKPRYIYNNYKGCGVYLFDLQIFDAIRNTPRTAMRDEYEITNSIQILLDEGCPVYAAEVIDWDMNVTYPEDLIICNQRQLKYLKKDKIIGRNAQLDRRIQVSRSVIGDGVRITKPIKVKDSVIFGGVKIDADVDLERCLVTPDLTIDCKNKIVYGVMS